MTDQFHAQRRGVKGMKKLYFLIFAILIASIYGCSTHFYEKTQGSTRDMIASDNIQTGDREMLDEIYAKPIRGGKRINVNDIVLKFIPIGTNIRDASMILKNQSVKKINKSVDFIFAEDERELSGGAFFPILKYTEIHLIFNADERLIDTQSFLFLDSL